MKGDFTRDTFSPLRHFSRVLMQQGRVQLDADWNEQASILLYYLRTLAADLIGPHGGPNLACGFGVMTANSNLFKSVALNAAQRDFYTKAINDGGFLLSPGHYYVGGILVENEDWTPFNQQPSFSISDDDRDKLNGNYLVYLDVWERHICTEENVLNDGRLGGGIREVALGGPDSATRAQVIWQALLSQVDEQDWASMVGPAGGKGAGAKGGTSKPVEKPAPGKGGTEISGGVGGGGGGPTLTPEQYLAKTFLPSTGTLRARAKSKANPADVCTISPDAMYRGPGNQLYRVEIHSVDRNVDNHVVDLVYKWSRENGSVIFPLVKDPDVDTQGKIVRLELATLGRDERLGVKPGDFLELVDDTYSLSGGVQELLEVRTVDRDERVVTAAYQNTAPAGFNLDQHLYARRWDGTGEADYKDAAADPTKYWDLEDGISVQFDFDQSYLSGDFWLIPARTITGDVEWPPEVQDGKVVTDSQGNPVPQALLPHGPQHGYAPLALLVVTNGTFTFVPNLDDLRKTWNYLAV